MAVEVQALMFCSAALIRPTDDGRHRLDLLGVFGQRKPGPAAFTIFTSFRGDAGTYRVEIAFEDPDGQRVYSCARPIEITNELDWKFWGVDMRCDHLAPGVWTAKLFVDGSFKQLSTFIVTP